MKPGNPQLPKWIKALHALHQRRRTKFDDTSCEALSSSKLFILKLPTCSVRPTTRKSHSKLCQSMMRARTHKFIYISISISIYIILYLSIYIYILDISNVQSLYINKYIYIHTSASLCIYIEIYRYVHLSWIMLRVTPLSRPHWEFFMMAIIRCAVQIGGWPPILDIPLWNLTASALQLYKARSRTACSWDETAKNAGRFWMLANIATKQTSQAGKQVTKITYILVGGFNPSEKY